MDIAYVLNIIPLPVAATLAVIGLVPFVMALRKPPRGAMQLMLYSAFYIAGAVGMASSLSQTLLLA